MIRIPCRGDALGQRGAPHQLCGMLDAVAVVDFPADDTKQPLQLLPQCYGP